MLPKAPGDVAHLLQDLGQLRVAAGDGRGLASRQRQLLLAGRQQPAADHPGVGGVGVGHTFHAAEADVEHVAVGILGRRGAGVQLHAGDAPAGPLVVAGRPHPVLSRPLHSHEPGAPVQQDHARLPTRGRHSESQGPRKRRRAANTFPGCSAGWTTTLIPRIISKRQVSYNIKCFTLQHSLKTVTDVEPLTIQGSNGWGGSGIGSPILAFFPRRDHGGDTVTPKR